MSIFWSSIFFVLNKGYGYPSHHICIHFFNAYWMFFFYLRLDLLLPNTVLLETISIFLKKYWKQQIKEKYKNYRDVYVWIIKKGSRIIIFIEMCMYG